MQSAYVFEYLYHEHTFFKVYPVLSGARLDNMNDFFAVNQLFVSLGDYLLHHSCFMNRLII